MTKAAATRNEAGEVCTKKKKKRKGQPPIGTPCV